MHCPLLCRSEPAAAAAEAAAGRGAESAAAAAAAGAGIGFDFAAGGAGIEIDVLRAGEIEAALLDVGGRILLFPHGFQLVFETEGNDQRDDDIRLF